MCTLPQGPLPSLPIKEVPLDAGHLRKVFLVNNVAIMITIKHETCVELERLGTKAKPTYPSKQICNAKRAVDARGLGVVWCNASVLSVSIIDVEFPWEGPSEPKPDMPLPKGAANRDKLLSSYQSGQPVLVSAPQACSGHNAMFRIMDLYLEAASKANGRLTNLKHKQHAVWPQGNIRKLALKGAQIMVLGFRINMAISYSFNVAVTGSVHACLLLLLLLFLDMLLQLDNM